MQTSANSTACKKFTIVVGVQTLATNKYTKAMKKFLAILVGILLLPVLAIDIFRTAYNWRSQRFVNVAKFCFGAFCHTVENTLKFN